MNEKTKAVEWCPECGAEVEVRVVTRGGNMGRPYCSCEGCGEFWFTDTPLCPGCGRHTFVARSRRRATYGRRFTSCPNRCQGAFRWLTPERSSRS